MTLRHSRILVRCQRKYVVAGYRRLCDCLMK